MDSLSAFRWQPAACTQRFDFLADLGRLGDQELEAHQRQGLIEPAHDGADIESGSGGTHQKGRVDWRVKERELLKHSLEVEAVMNLEQPVRHCIPVAEQLVVSRDAEVQCLPDAGQNLRAVGFGARTGREA